MTTTRRAKRKAPLVGGLATGARCIPAELAGTAYRETLATGKNPGVRGRAPIARPIGAPIAGTAAAIPDAARHGTPAGGVSGILDTGVLTGERASWERQRAAEARLRARLGGSWQRLAARQARHAARLGLEPERVLEALEGARGPEPGAIGRALARVREAELVVGGALRGLPEPVGPTQAEARASHRAAVAELARLRAWRRLAMYAGRATRVRGCGEGTVAEADGQLVLSHRCGLPLCDVARCEVRFCPRCDRRAARKKARELAGALRVGYEGLCTSPLVGNLTCRPAPAHVVEHVAFTAAGAALRRFERSRAAQRILAGGEAHLEVTRSTPETRAARADRYERAAAELEAGRSPRPREKTPAQYREHAARLRSSSSVHWHAHVSVMLVPTGYRERTYLERHELDELHRAWRRALAAEWRARGWEGDPGGMVHLEVPERGLEGAARECAKYAVKGTDVLQLTDDELDACVRAFDGLRAVRRWGVLSSWHRAREQAASLELELVCQCRDDEEGFDEDEGEDEAAAARRERREWIGKTQDGRLVKRREAIWRPLDEDTAWRVYLHRQAARERWLIRLRGCGPPTGPLASRYVGGD